MAGQVRALFFLKLTIMKNAWMKGKRLSFIIGAFFALLVVLTSFAVAAGLFALAWYFPDMLSTSSPEAGSAILLLACDGLVGFFFLAWIGALLAELQRSEVIDFRKMLFLPVPLRLVFLLNFIAALISPALLLFMVPLIGLALGLSLAYGSQMVLVVPLGMAFYFMLAGWTYYVRGLLVFLMENKRRRRAILVIVPMFFALLGQMPALLNLTVFSSMKNHASAHDRMHDPHSPTALATNTQWIPLAKLTNTIVPLGWLPLGIMHLAGGAFGGPLLAFAGLTVLGSGGLTVGYRSTLRHYTGTARRRPVRVPPKRNRKRAPVRSTLLRRRLPGMDDDTAAFAFASYLGYIRHPQVRMQLVFPLVMGVVMIFYFQHMELNMSGAFLRVLAPVGIALWPVLTMAHFIFNVFGIDPDGFRTLVLLPSRRYKFFIGKNLGLLPVTAGIGVVFVIVSSFIFPFRLAVFVQALAQVIQIYLLFCIIGNFLSIYFPYRIRYQGRQSLQSGGVSRAFTILLVFPLILCGFVVCLIPSAFALSVNVLLANASPWVTTLAGLLTAATFFVLTIIAYWVSVRAAGDLLMRREQSVVDALLRDRE